MNTRNSLQRKASAVPPDGSLGARYRNHPQAASVTARLAALPHLSMPELWALWDEHFSRRPGHHHRTYLESRLAYKIQEAAFGGLSPTIRRKLEKVGETGLIPGHDKKADSRIVPGTVLVREFNGLEHRVQVLPDMRYEYQGRPYKSLSAVARAITGTQWSGPAFFGLKASAGKVCEEVRA